MNKKTRKKIFIWGSLASVVGMSSTLLGFMLSSFTLFFYGMLIVLAGLACMATYHKE